MSEYISLKLTSILENAQQKIKQSQKLMNKDKLSASKRQLECGLTSSIKLIKDVFSMLRVKRFQCKMVGKGKACIG